MIPLRSLKIPIYGAGGHGMEYVEVVPHEYGDPYSVTILLSQGICECGKLNLPRKVLLEMTEIATK